MNFFNILKTNKTEDESNNILEETNIGIVNTNETEPQLYIKLKKLDERAVIPSYAHHGDVGMDMTAIDVEYDAEHDTYIYHTGLAFESNFNVAQFLFLRSGNSKKECYLTNGVGIADSAIYRGEIQFRMKNRTSLKVEAELETTRLYTEIFLKSVANWDGNKKSWKKVIEHATEVAKEETTKLIEDFANRAKNFEFAPYKVGDRVGQMVFMNYPTVNIEVVDELSTTERGDGGFGSTGN